MENKALRVDVRGMRCPWPVLRAARMLRDHTEILILADDPAAPGELRSFAQERGWRLAEERIGEGFARSEEHTSELPSLMRTSYAVFCLKKTTPYSTAKHSTPH